MLKQFQNEILQLRAQLETNGSETSVEKIRSAKVKKPKINSNNMIENAQSDEEGKEEPEELLEIQKTK